MDPASGRPDSREAFLAFERPRDSAKKKKKKEEAQSAILPITTTPFPKERAKLTQSMFAGVLSISSMMPRSADENVNGSASAEYAGGGVEPSAGSALNVETDGGGVIISVEIFSCAKPSPMLVHIVHIIVIVMCAWNTDVKPY